MTGGSTGEAQTLTPPAHCTAHQLSEGTTRTRVVRLEGTNAEEARIILEQSKVSIISAKGMKDAAEKVVSAALGS